MKQFTSTFFNILNLQGHAVKKILPKVPREGINGSIGNQVDKKVGCKIVPGGTNGVKEKKKGK